MSYRNSDITIEIAEKKIELTRARAEHMKVLNAALEAKLAPLRLELLNLEEKRLEERMESAEAEMSERKREEFSVRRAALRALIDQ